MIVSNHSDYSALPHLKTANSSSTTNYSPYFPSRQPSWWPVQPHPSVLQSLILTPSHHHLFVLRTLSGNSTLLLIRGFVSLWGNPKHVDISFLSLWWMPLPKKPPLHTLPPASSDLAPLLLVWVSPVVVDSGMGLVEVLDLLGVLEVAPPPARGAESQFFFYFLTFPLNRWRSRLAASPGPLFRGSVERVS